MTLPTFTWYELYAAFNCGLLTMFFAFVVHKKWQERRETKSGLYSKRIRGFRR